MFQRCVLPPSSGRRSSVYVNESTFHSAAILSEDDSLSNCRPWWWRQYAPLKRRSTSMRLHGAESQKDVTFILAAVRIWNLTSSCLFMFENITNTHTHTHARTHTYLLVVAFILVEQSSHAMFFCLWYADLCRSANSSSRYKRLIFTSNLIQMKEGYYFKTSHYWFSFIRLLDAE